MSQHQYNYRASTGRAHWGSYGFVAGILVGVFLGWFFHGFVGAFLRVGIAAIVLSPLILVFIAWRRYISPWFRPARESSFHPSASAIETRGVMREPQMH
jgi:hypothetical protein